VTAKTTIFSLFLLLSLPLAFAGIEDYTIYYGTVTLGGSNLGSGNTISATIGGTAAGSTTTTTSGEYKLVVSLPSNASNGAAITISLATPSGYDSVSAITGNTYSTSNNGKFTRLNLAFTGTATAASAGTSEGAAGGGSAAAASGGEGGVSTPGTKVTSPAVVSKIAGSLPEGWTNIDVYQIGSTKAEAVTTSLGDIISTALKEVTEAPAVEVIRALQEAFAANEITQVIVTKAVESFQINNKDTGEIAYRSTVTLTFTAPADMEEVTIVEVIPKSVASSADALFFPGEKPKILQRDPVVEWFFESVRKGESKDLSYTVSTPTKLSTADISSITIAAGKEAAAAPPVERKVFTKQAVVGLLIVVLIVLIGLLIYYYVEHHKSKKKK